MKRVVIPILTNTGGTATTYGESVVGTVYAVQLIDGDLADGVDVAITSEQESLSIPILTKADFNSDQIAYPRVLQALNTDGTALTTHCEPLCYGRIKVVIAQGGAVKTGSVIVYVREYI
jgi:hypothetical protein